MSTHSNDDARNANHVEQVLAECEELLDEAWRDIERAGASEEAWSRLQRALTRYNRALAARAEPTKNSELRLVS